MIDISMLAPAAQAPAFPGNALVANSPKESAPGAQGFLRLFEIVLDGMPRPVQPESVDVLQMPAGSATMDPQASLTGTAGSLDALAPETTTLPDAASLQIAKLLQGLGFDVDADQIMTLGPLDRLQLDQAMEFIHRGLEAGMATGELLENASFLMPREWDYQGPQDRSTPRSEGLAVSSPEAQGLDPAQILAATEAVRQMLALSMPVAVATPPTADPTIQATTAATVNAHAVTPGVAASVAVSVAAIATPPSVAPIAKDASASDGDVAGAPTLDTTRTSSEGEAVPVTESDIPTPVQAGARKVPSPPDPSASTRVRDPAIRISASQPSDPTVSVVTKAARAEVPEASPNAAPAAESASRSTDASSALTLSARAHAPLAESRIATAEGVKPGSMASEFIGRQVLEKVDVHLRQGKRELTVRLWPEELGEVRLSLRIGEADKLDARILVQNEGVRQALLDATPQLREALARHGMELGRLSVNVDSGRSEAQMAEGDRRDPGGREGRRETPQRGWREQEMEYAGALALGVDSGIRDGRNTLDMWS